MCEFVPAHIAISTTMYSRSVTAAVTADKAVTVTVAADTTAGDVVVIDTPI